MSEDNLIYHYCPLDALVSIIETKHLWMSDVAKMNDPDEIMLGQQAIIEQFYRTNPTRLRWIKTTFKLKSFRYLTVCFSKNGDMLSQWRAYSSDGTGVSLGFDTEELLSYNQRSSLSFSEIIYDHQLIKNKAKELFHRHKDAFRIFVKNGEHSTGSFSTDLEIVDELIQLSMFYKSAFYKEECEVRFIELINSSNVTSPEYLSNLNLRFRTSKYGLIPFKTFNFSDKSTTALRKVIIGPNSPIEVSDMELLLAVNGFESVEVLKSNGSYR